MTFKNVIILSMKLKKRVLKKIILENARYRNDYIRYLLLTRERKIVLRYRQILHMWTYEITVENIKKESIINLFVLDKQKAAIQRFQRYMAENYVLPEYKISYILILLACFCFFYVNWGAIKQKICRLLFFEKGDPRYMLVRKFGLSNRVVDLLFDRERLIILNKLIIRALYIREDLLKIEGLEKTENEQIVRKIDEFVHDSWTLTALFYCNFDKLKVKPWWFRLIVYISRKRKDPAFFFISELGLSTEITSFLMEEKIYTIEDLLIIIRNTRSSQWWRFVNSKELAYIDLIEIYTTVYSFLHS